MVQFLKRNLKLIQLLVALLVGFPVAPCLAWTNAHLFNVTVSTDLASTGPSTVTTDARFVVEGGYFHGFDFADMPGARLDKEKTVAFRDDQQEFKVEFKRMKSGKIRVLIADDKYVRGGGITFRIVHHIDFVENGNLRADGDRAVFDWTPLVWDVGQDNMRVQIRLPESAHSDVRVDGAVTRDYVSTVSSDQVNFIKFRPVKWYAMRVALNVNKDAFSNLDSLSKPPDTQVAAVVDGSSPFAPRVSTDHSTASRLLPMRDIALIALVCLIGWFAGLQKTRFVFNGFQTMGKSAGFLFLKRTSLGTRAVLSFAAFVFAVAVQAFGYTAASVPLIIAASSLFLVKKESIASKPRGGGNWCEMNEREITWYLELYKAYVRSRSSFVDITTIKGLLAFLSLVAGLIAVFLTAGSGSDAAFAGIMNGILLWFPAWFAFVRAELPQDHALESFGLVKRWKKSLCRMISDKASDPKVRLFVRKDDEGPIEIRVRAEIETEGVRSVDVAAEAIGAGTLYRIRTAFLLRAAPGSVGARRSAASQFAVEHHLSPDLKEEIIVLRNRRGKTASGLLPLREVFSS